MKEGIELELSKNSNAFEVQDRLKRFSSIKVHAVTTTRLRIYFNNSKITAKRVIKLVRNQEEKGKKKSNVVHIKNVEQSSNPAA